MSTLALIYIPRHYPDIHFVLYDDTPSMVWVLILLSELRTDTKAYHECWADKISRLSFTLFAEKPPQEKPPSP